MLAAMYVYRLTFPHWVGWALLAGVLLALVAFACFALLIGRRR